MFEAFVQLDPAFQNLVALGVTFVVSWILLQLAALSPALAEYLGQYKVGIVTWLTGLAAQLIQAQLNKIPATWEEVAFLVQKLIVEVVAVLLGMAALRRFKVKGYHAL